MDDNRNNRETGARHLPAKAEADANDEFSQDAATNRKPPGGMGLAEPSDDHNEKTRHADGKQSSRTTVTAQKVSGAGPAIAARSKDAQAQKRSGEDK